MRKFETHSRINFVDNKDVYVGYDFTQSCCEYFGYIYTDKLPDTMIRNIDKIPKIDAPSDLESFDFDPNFFKQINLYDRPDADDGAIAFFKLTNGDRELYLALFNQHNGYYGHGFDVKISGKVVKFGTL